MSLTVVTALMNGCGPGFNVTDPFNGSLSQSSTGTAYLSGDFDKFMQVMNKNCVACHGAANSPFPVVSNFAVLNSVQKWVDAKLIVPKSPSESSVYYRLALGDGKGPKNMPMAFGSIANNMNQEEVDFVKSFINSIELQVVEDGDETAPTPTPTPTPDPGAGGQSSLQCNTIDRGLAQNRMNRLTKFELTNTVGQIFGTSILNTSAVQGALDSYINDSSYSLGEYMDNQQANALTYFSLGKAIADELLNNSSALSSVLPGCNVSTNINACKTALVETLGPKAYRRPLNSDQKSRIQSIVDEVGGEDGVKVAIMTLVASPFFNQHIELGEDGESESQLCAKQVASISPGSNQVFWHPDGGVQAYSHNGQINSAGWFVSEYSAQQVSSTIGQVVLNIEVQGSVTLKVNINDVTRLDSKSLSTGTHKIVIDSNTYSSGSALKVGMYFTPSSGSTVKVINSVISNMSADNCTSTSSSSNLGDRAKLSQFEIASRISYRAAGIPPDNSLLNAAANNQLNNVASVKSHVERVLNSTAGRKKIRNLFITWLDMEQTRVPADVYANAAGVDANALANDTQEEYEKFIEYIVFDKKGHFKDLHTDNTIFAHTANLAKYYGVNQSNAPQKDPTGNFKGLILRPGVLITSATNTSPITRGNFVRMHFLCDHLPDPDPNLVSSALKDFHEDPLMQSTRQIAEGKTSSPVCMSCHAMINPLGFALENMGPFGKVRSVESVFDTNGNVVANHNIDSYVDNANFDPGMTVPLSNAQSLAEEIVESPKAKMCIATKLIEYNRNIKINSKDNCVLNEMTEILDGNGSIYDSFVKSIASDDIFYKAAGE